MIKGNIENSLKRFLKRKIKFTLGLMVTFLITGAFSFSAESTEWIEGIGNTDNKFPTLQGEKISITENGIISFEDKQINLSSVTGNISNKEKEVLNIMANMLDKEVNGNNEAVIDGSKIEGYNEGLNAEIVNKGISNQGQTISGNKTGANYGIININQLGQVIDGKGYNYGIINVEKWGQRINSGKAFNYGVINTTSADGQITWNADITAYNYGIISAATNSQNLAGDSKGFNYGILISFGANASAQVSSKGADFYNYGVINGNTYGQRVISEDGTVTNYGSIHATGTGQEINGTGKAYNYGIISTNTGVAINNNGSSDAENYGVIKNSIGNIFSGNVKNEGIVILEKDNLSNLQLGSRDEDKDGKTDKQGVILNKDYSLYDKDNPDGVNSHVKELTSSDKIISGDPNKTYYANNISGITFDKNLTGNVLTAVVTTNQSEAVYKYTGNDNLILNDTTITGYFVNGGGTLLDLTNKEMIIGKGSVINAVGDNSVAVQLGENGSITTIGNAHIVGKIDGGNNENTSVKNVAQNSDKGETIIIKEKVSAQEVTIRNATSEEKVLIDTGKNFTNIEYQDLHTDKLTLNFTEGETNKKDKVKINGNSEIKEISGITSTRDTELTIENIEKIGDIALGSGNDTLTIEKNGKHGENKIINMGEGEDTFTVNNFAQNVTREEEKDNHKELGTFDYKLEGVETIVLKGEKGDNKNNKGWHIGSSASVSSVDSAELKIVGSELHVEMNNNYGTENVTTSLDNFAEEGTSLKVTTENAEVKFTVGDKFDVAQKEFTIATNYDISGANISSAVIFKTDKINENGKDVTLTVKEASELGLSQYKGIYDAVIKTLSKDEDLRNAVNYQEADDFVKMVKDAGVQAETFYTTGYAVTKDIADTYMSVADDFGRKAGAGEWIAYGKYVNSDTEFDGGKASKGYDGDITGTVGMIEYGVDNTTSYGIIYGQGDTKVNISGNGGKLEGDNTYFGGYVKHRTEKGIDFTGNIGITKSELDLKLANDITTQGGVNHRIITDGKSDAEALTFAIKGTKDYKISDSLKVQPVISGRYSFITQDEIKSSDANFRMDKQDVTIFEGSFGGNIIKEFELSHGTLSFSTGAEYILTDVNTEDSTRYYIHESTPLKFTEEEDIADNRIEGHIGTEYIHENGVGINAKYEMIWTDKGDTNRITAGMSYRF